MSTQLRELDFRDLLSSSCPLVQPFPASTTRNSPAHEQAPDLSHQVLPGQCLRQILHQHGMQSGN